MWFLAAGELLHELGDPPGARLGAFRVLDPVEDRVAVLAVERGEELARLFVPPQRALEVVRHDGVPRAVVRRLPATVRLRALDLREPRRPHQSGLDQPRRRLAVDLRPLAPRPPREEALQVVRLVETPRLRVDPAVAERNLERLGVGDSRDAGALLRELHPHAGLLAVVGVEPLRPRAARAEHLGPLLS